MGKTYKDTRKAKDGFTSEGKKRRRPKRKERDNFSSLRGWSYKDVSENYVPDQE